MKIQFEYSPATFGDIGNTLNFKYSSIWGKLFEAMEEGIHYLKYNVKPRYSKIENDWFISMPDILKPSLFYNANIFFNTEVRPLPGKLERIFLYNCNFKIIPAYEYKIVLFYNGSLTVEDSDKFEIELLRNSPPTTVG